jgi:hypothetical protein
MRHAPAALYSQGNDHNTHWIRGWVGLTAGLATEAKKIFFSLAGHLTSVDQSVVRHYTDRDIYINILYLYN